MKKVRVFAPASIANMGCGFDVIGLALDEVGDIIEITQSEGDGLTITNNSGVPLPEDIEKNVITPVVRSFLAKIGQKAQIGVTICEKIYPGSGPSMFALCDHRSIAEKAGSIMKDHFESRGIGSEVYVVKVSNKGAKLTGITL